MIAVAEKPIEIGTEKPVTAQTGRRAKEGRTGPTPKVSAILAWHQQVYRNAALPASAYRLAMALTQHLRLHPEAADGFCCNRQQKWLAAEIKMSRKSIQAAFTALVANGHLEVEGHKSEGRSNLYVLTLRSAEEASASSTDPEPVEPPEAASEDIVFAPVAPVAPVEPAPEAIEARLIELAEIHRELLDEIEAAPSQAQGARHKAPEMFDVFQTAFPAECRSPPGGSAASAFLEITAWGWTPAAIFLAAVSDRRDAEAGGEAVQTVKEWLSNFLTYATGE